MPYFKEDNMALVDNKNTEIEKDEVLEEVKEEKKVAPKKEKVTTVSETVVDNKDDDIVDIEISSIKRKRFRLNGDPNKVISLNMSDLGLYNRLEKGYAELRRIASEIPDVEFDPENDSIEQLDRAMNTLDKLDRAMKEQIDYIFDAEVADKASDGGTMYDPYNGTLRYEHILETLLGLYNTNITNEFKLMRKNMSKHTAKYAQAPIGNNRAARRAKNK